MIVGAIAAFSAYDPRDRLGFKNLIGIPMAFPTPPFWIGIPLSVLLLDPAVHGPLGVRDQTGFREARAFVRSRIYAADDAAIFRAALSDAEVEAIYRATGHLSAARDMTELAIAQADAERDDGRAYPDRLQATRLVARVAASRALHSCSTKYHYRRIHGRDSRRKIGDWHLASDRRSLRRSTQSAGGR